MLGSLAGFVGTVFANLLSSQLLRRMDVTFHGAWYANLLGIARYRAARRRRLDGSPVSASLVRGHSKYCAKSKTFLTQIETPLEHKSGAIFRLSTYGRLEDDLQGELCIEWFTRSYAREHRSKAPMVEPIVPPAPVCGASYGSQVGVIEKVKHLHPELSIDPFSNFGVLEILISQYLQIPGL